MYRIHILLTIEWLILKRPSPICLFTVCELAGNDRLMFTASKAVVNIGAVKMQTLSSLDRKNLSLIHKHDAMLST